MPQDTDSGTTMIFPFENIASGWFPFASPRSYSPKEGPIWQKLVNLRWQDGVLEKRRSAIALTDVFTGGESAQPPCGYSEASRTEFPLYLFQVESDESISPFRRRIVTVMVTSSDIYVYEPSVGWKVLTPIYIDGTATWSSSSSTVTGSGTLWSTRKISVGSQIQLNGNWHEITAVVSNTQLTVSPNTAASGSGASYTIRRCFGGANDTSFSSSRIGLYVKMFNGNLYVAGTHVGGLDQPAVVVCSPIYPDPDEADYLTAKDDLTGSLDEVTTLVEVRGLEILEDGRATIATTESLTGAGPASNNWVATSRIRWSSHLDQVVWTTTPAGFTDVTAGGKGAILAYEKFGRDYTLHYRDTIVLATLTGQDTPPLAFRKTHAHRGCKDFRTIRNFMGSQFFVAPDLAIYVFDGRTTRRVTNVFRERMLDYLNNEADWVLFSALDTHWNEYHVYFRNPTGNGEVECFSIDLDNGEVRWEVIPVEFYAIADEWFGPPAGHSISTRTKSNTMAAQKITSALNSPLFILRDRDDGDNAGLDFHVASPSEGIEAVTGTLDWGFPTYTSIIERIAIRMRLGENAIAAPTATDTLEVGISADNGTTWRTVNLTFSMTTRGVEVVKHAIFDEYPSENWLIRIKSTTDDFLAGQITRIVAKVALIGEEEAQEDL